MVWCFFFLKGGFGVLQFLGVGNELLISRHGFRVCSMAFVEKAFANRLGFFMKGDERLISSAGGASELFHDLRAETLRVDGSQGLG